MWTATYSRYANPTPLSTHKVQMKSFLPAKTLVMLATSFHFELWDYLPDPCRPLPYICQKWSSRAISRPKRPPSASAAHHVFSGLLRLPWPWQPRRHRHMCCYFLCNNVGCLCFVCDLPPHPYRRQGARPVGVAQPASGHLHMLHQWGRGQRQHPAHRKERQEKGELSASLDLLAVFASSDASKILLFQCLKCFLEMFLTVLFIKYSFKN